MFEPAPAPRIFGVPPGADFARAVVAGLVARTRGQPPEVLARARLFANSGRMLRRLRDAFDAHAPILVPRIELVGAAEGLPAQGALRRRLELARLVSALLAREPGIAPGTAAFDLADSLLRLMDEMQIEGVPPEALERVDAGPHAAHWGRSLEFLRILGPLFADPAGSEGGRIRAAIDARIAAWRADPPQTPVIVAGSTGSRGAVLDLMRAVAALPQGALILPGFDFDQPAEVWRTLAAAGAEGEDHPQYRFARLLDRLGIGPGDVRPWPAPAPCPARNRLISLALRPAPVTHQWRTEGARLADLAEATGAVALIEAPSPRVEAVAIALRLRRAVEDGVTAALVTPDRALGRRVTAAVGRWGIEPDDSAGRPLGQTAPGRLLRHVAALFGRRATAETLLVLLKHPLVASGDERNQHLLRTRMLELRLRRYGPPFPTPADIARPDDPWSAWVAATAFPDPLADDAPLTDRVRRHLALAEALAAGPGATGAGALWEEEPGRRAQAAMDELIAAADAGGPMSAAAYEALIAAHLTAEVREATGPHPGVMILGTLEARVGGADLVILGGLNEGVWPPAPAPDPWLNRRMRAEAGLLLPERQIGLSAHDFQQAVAAREVVLTRSLRDTEAETVPSRWLNRLENLLRGLGAVGGPEALAAMRARGAAWLAAAETHGRLPQVPPAPRPSPRPPVAARPRQLPITRIETLVRDPYAVYARHVLTLRALPPLRSEADAALRGKVLHRIAELFVEGGPDPDLAAATARLGAIADAVLTSEVQWPVARRLWRGRFGRVSAWLAAEELRRRARGTPAAVEERGSWPVPGLDFTLVGQPDRVDRLHAGGHALVDYKSGRVPTRKAMASFDRQLLLGAAMIEGGAFGELGPARVAEVSYISLGGTGRVETYPLPYDDGETAFDVASTVAELRELIASYARRETGYTSRRAAFLTTWPGDYDHLARFGEWDDSAPAAPEDVG